MYLTRKTLRLTKARLQRISTAGTPSEHINLMAAVESEFGIKFSMGQIVTMKNVGEMADIILQKV